MRRQASSRRSSLEVNGIALDSLGEWASSLHGDMFHERGDGLPNGLLIAEEAKEVTLLKLGCFNVNVVTRLERLDEPARLAHSQSDETNGNVHGDALGMGTIDDAQDFVGSVLFDLSEMLSGQLYFALDLVDIVSATLDDEHGLLTSDGSLNVGVVLGAQQLDLAACQIGTQVNTSKQNNLKTYHSCPRSVLRELYSPQQQSHKTKSSFVKIDSVG